MTQCIYCHQKVYLVRGTTRFPSPRSLEEGAELLVYGLVGHDLELAQYARDWADGLIFLVDHAGRVQCPRRPTPQRAGPPRL